MSWTSEAGDSETRGVTGVCLHVSSLALSVLSKVDANGQSDRAWLNQIEAVRDHISSPARNNAAFVRNVVSVEIDCPSTKFRAGFQISLCVRGQILSLRTGDRKGV